MVGVMMFRQSHAKRVGNQFTVKEDHGSKLLIIGVTHTKEEEVGEVMKEVTNGRKPRKVGMELPSDYEERESAGIKIKIFSSIANALKSQGIKVFPLETAECFNLAQAWAVAKSIESGRIRIEDVMQRYESGRRESEDPYKEPNIRIVAKRDMDVFGRAIKIIERNKGDPEGLSKLFATINNLRNTQMTAAARLHDVDTIIVGAAHAAELAKDLGRFTHINSKSSEPYLKS
jgi:hypothetical protein